MSTHIANIDANILFKLCLRLQVHAHSISHIQVRIISENSIRTKFVIQSTIHFDNTRHRHYKRL